MRICEPALCTGCGACQNICPQNCISIRLDDEGFFKFFINEEHCVQCNLCIKTCPANGYDDFVEKAKPKAFLCWNLDDSVRRQSSSGGIFTLLAEQTLGDKGLVFGASFDEQFNVRHVGIENREELYQLRGSKYVQSHTGRTFEEVRSALQGGRRVLYSGTPCQIAGLYKFLGRDDPNLLTCDVVCHGVCSISVFKDILKYYEERNKSKIIDLKFRDKSTGWKASSVTISFQSGQVISEIRDISLLAYGFAVGFTNSYTCSRCRHAVIPRRADITMGDYGAGDYYLYDKQDVKDGMSLVLVNSPKGDYCFQQIMGCMFHQEKALDRVLQVQQNIARSNELHPLRQQFFTEYKERDFSEIKRKYLVAPMKIKFIYAFGVERYEKIKRVLRKAR